MTERYTLLNVIAYVLMEKQKMRQGVQCNPKQERFMEWMFSRITNGELVKALWKNYEWLSSDNTKPPKFLKDDEDKFYYHMISEQQKIIELLFIVFEENWYNCSGELYLKMLKKFREENFSGLISRFHLGVNTYPVIQDAAITINWLSQFLLVTALNIQQLVMGNENVFYNKQKAP